MTKIKIFFIKLGKQIKRITFIVIAWFKQIFLISKNKIDFSLLHLTKLIKEHPLMSCSILISIIYGSSIIIFGAIKLSYFIGITGSCTLIFGITKLYALNKYNKILANENLLENKVAKNMAICTSVMAFLHFSIAMVCTFFEEENPANYGLIFIIIIAAVAFTKIILTTINVFRTRRNHNPVIHNIKLIDNANALITIGLLQRTIIYYVGINNMRLISGIGGMFFSLCALSICLTMFLKNK